ncbi:hypothetical protein BRADI_3g51585v3 [Brachypodium distachyon]|uniref:Uncharacterized protein n=1 Tax=Brachypodium distachyon TaxID=15368 RepID=A0A2K2D4M8_BRADI|nr:hypothetical protein BRADI_3g51585v3 [Brachypodium distachyon]
MAGALLPLPAAVPHLPSRPSLIYSAATAMVVDALDRARRRRRPCPWLHLSPASGKKATPPLHLHRGRSTASPLPLRPAVTRHPSGSPGRRATTSYRRRAAPAPPHSGTPRPARQGIFWRRKGKKS